MGPAIGPRSFAGAQSRAVRPWASAPSTMPPKAHKMSVLPVPKAAMAGPGHTPLKPQPTPKMAEPMTVWRFQLAGWVRN